MNTDLARSWGMTARRGVYRSLDNLTYHSDGAISNSDCKLIRKSIAHFKDGRADSQTWCKDFGSAFHALLLEPARFSAEYVKGLDVGRRSKADKEAWQDFEANNRGKLPVNAEDWQALQEMVANVRAHPEAARILRGGNVEPSIFGEDPDTGFMVRCRPDYLKTDGIIVDLKTTRDGSVDAWDKAILNFEYHMQAAFYLSLCSQVIGGTFDVWIFVIVENKPPYNVAFRYLDGQSLEIGSQWYREALTRLRRYVDAPSKSLEGYSPKLESCGLPTWAKLRYGEPY